MKRMLSVVIRDDNNKVKNDIIIQSTLTIINWIIKARSLVFWKTIKRIPVKMLHPAKLFILSRLMYAKAYKRAGKRKKLNNPLFIFPFKNNPANIMIRNILNVSPATSSFNKRNGPAIANMARIISANISCFLSSV